MKEKVLRVAVLCGGPSLERGISLNSARSLCDHLDGKNIEVVPLYFDQRRRAYPVSRGQLYSNTPSDFDFKLGQKIKPLSEGELAEFLRGTDLVFPAMHGAFGEDGALQKMLENFNLPYVGSDAEACQRCFDKYRANEFIRKHGFYAAPSFLLAKNTPDRNEEVLARFFADNKHQRAVVKPATGGSSIGVHSVQNQKEARAAMLDIWAKKIDTRAVIEPFCQGKEFTVIILESRDGKPVAIFPTEIAMDYRENNIFDYRKKYLATNHVSYHCPPRFPIAIIDIIQNQAEQLFKLLGMRDFARFDGWLLDNGEIWFSDFNPVSGMEQNSFLFLQGAQIGLSHEALLRFIIGNACRRWGIAWRENPEIDGTQKVVGAPQKKPINVLFGGKTAERQVSVMSGTNVWLKLRKSQKYEPTPYLLDLDNDSVWRLPYAKTLNHTVEEIGLSCRESAQAEIVARPLREKVWRKLGLEKEKMAKELFLPEKMTLAEFVNRSDFIFIGLHGGIGENGVLQKKLEEAGKRFNGSGSCASALCMDKHATAQKLKDLTKEGIFTPRQKPCSAEELQSLTGEKLKLFWRNLKAEFPAGEIIIKPRADGCSAGIVKIATSDDLELYLHFWRTQAPFIPAGAFYRQETPIEMPTDGGDFIFEEYIVSDKVAVIGQELRWETVSGWIEITVGVLGGGSSLKAFNPSLTVAGGEILSLEEKFQGGTGVNITPPPESHVGRKALSATKKRVEIAVRRLGISGYARLDAFMEVKSGKLIVLEVNTTPALTPSTVIYHQALAEKKPLSPLAFLERIIEEAGK